MSMVLPGVVGFKLTGKLRTGVTATDLVLTVTQILRKFGVVGKFVEFYGKHRFKCFSSDSLATLYLQHLEIDLIFMACVFTWIYGDPCLGKGMSELTLADRATIANMSPEYGATMGFFPVDRVTLQYLRMTGRDEKRVNICS